MKSKRPEKQLFLRVSRGVLPRPDGTPREDGRRLVAQCLNELRRHASGVEREDQWNFPPQLLVLLATVSFQPFEETLAGIQEQLRTQGLDIPLVGCSVAAVLTEDDVFPQGAALVCLSSRLIRARVGVAPDVLNHRETAIETLCRDIGLKQESINPDRNRFAICFLPGYVNVDGHLRYEAYEIHEALRQATQDQISLVGGGAADDFQRQDCWVFANGKVYQRSAVLALLDCDLRFGIGVRHGLTETGEFLFAQEVSADGHHIHELGLLRNGHFEHLSPQSFLSGYQSSEQHIVLGTVDADIGGERVVFSPLPNADGSMFAARKVKQYAALEVYRYGPDTVRSTVSEAFGETWRWAQMSPFHLALGLVFVSAARYKFAEASGLTVHKSLEKVREKFPGLPGVGGLMWGELGQEQASRSMLRNWSISTLLLADEAHPRSLHRRGYWALSKFGAKLAASNTALVDEVVSAAMSTISEVGLSGAMISLLFRDQNSYVIVAKQNVLGEGWKKVAEITQRRGSDEDILVRVAESSTAFFRPNAREGKLDDQDAVKRGNVISYYVAPLLTADGECLGAIQFGLGDMSDLEENELPEYLRTLLDAIAGQVAAAIAQAMRLHEQRLSERFDRALQASLLQTSVEGAAQIFMDEIMSDPVVFGVDIAHIRLLDETGRLRLVAGKGAYYEAARIHRPVTERDEISPTSKAFSVGRSTWVNDASHDPDASAFSQSVEHSQDLRDTLKGMLSYANLVIRAPDGSAPKGVITIGSKQRWFFSESVQRSMDTLGQRFFVAHQHAKQVEAHHCEASKTEFLLRITPPLDATGLRAGLRSHAEKIAKAAGAQVVSFFLWDPELQRLVLRGQFGWQQSSAVDIASYQLYEGMTGTMAMALQAEYIADLAAWKRENEQAPSQFEQQMFGSGRRPGRYECIVIPLHVSQPVGLLTLRSGEAPTNGLAFADMQFPLGVLVMQNAVEAAVPATEFVTHDIELLEQARKDITAFQLAMLAQEAARRDAEAHERAVEFGKLLLLPVSDLVGLAHRVCSHLTKVYRMGGCALYVPSEESGRLRLAGPPFVMDANAPAPVDATGDVSTGDSIVGEAYQNNRSAFWRIDSPSRHAPLESRASVRARSLLAQPICDYGQEPIGVLVAWDISHGPNDEYPWFTGRDQGEFAQAARNVARALASIERLHAIEAKRRGEGRLVYVGRVVSNLTHRIRNQMGAVLGDVRTLVDTLPDSDALQAAKCLEGSCQELALTAKNVLDTITTPESPLEDVEMWSLLDDIISQITTKAHLNSVEITPVLDADGALRIDRQDMREAVWNLLDNAINAMPKGGKLRIQTQFGSDKQTIVLEISDTGVGIAPADIPKVMEGFLRSSSSNRPGVGAFLARTAIEAHGGTIRYQSDVGQGTTVTITLPLLSTE